MHSSFLEKWSQVAFQPRYGKTTVNKWNVKVSLWIQSLGKGAISIYLSMIMTGMLGDWIPIILLDSLEFWFLALPLFYSIFFEVVFWYILPFPVGSPNPLVYFSHFFFKFMAFFHQLFFLSMLFVNLNVGVGLHLAVFFPFFGNRFWFARLINPND